MSSSDTIGHKRPLEDDSVASKRPRHENSQSEYSLHHDSVLDHSAASDLFLSSASSINSDDSALHDTFQAHEPIVAETSYRSVRRSMIDSDLYAPDVNELIDLQNEADIDIEALRRAMAEQEDLEPEEEDAENGSAVASSSDDDFDSDVEDEIDENDLPRLKDLQQAGLVAYNQQIKRAINQMVYSRNNIEPLELESDDDDESDVVSINHTTNSSEEIHINGSNGISPFDLPALANSSLSLPVVTPAPFEPVDRPVSSSSNDSNSEISNTSSTLPNPFTFPPQPIEPVEYDITPVILKSSRVGDAYQATDIPQLLSSEEKAVDESVMQIYDGEKVELDGIGQPPPNSVYLLVKDRQMNNQISAPPAALPSPSYEPTVETFAVRRPRASAQRARETIAEAIANEQSSIANNQPTNVIVHDVINESVHEAVSTS